MRQLLDVVLRQSSSSLNGSFVLGSTCWTPVGGRVRLVTDELGSVDVLVEVGVEGEVDLVAGRIENGKDRKGRGKSASQR